MGQEELETPQQTLARLQAASAAASSGPVAPPALGPRRERWTAHDHRVAAGVFLFLGAIFLWGMLPHAYLPGSPLTASTAGTVTNIDRSDELCDPTVVFTVAGVQHIIHSSVSANPCPWSMGRLADVRYNPQDPDDAELLFTGWARLWDLIPVLLLLAAAVSGLLALGRSVAERREIRAQADHASRTELRSGRAPAGRTRMG